MCADSRSPESLFDDAETPATVIADVLIPLALDIACDLIAYTGVALVDHAQPPIVVLSRVVDSWHSLELAQRQIPQRHAAHEVLEDYHDLIKAIRG